MLTLVVTECLHIQILSMEQHVVLKLSKLMLTTRAHGLSMTAMLFQLS